MGSVICFINIVIYVILRNSFFEITSKIACVLHYISILLIVYYWLCSCEKRFCMYWLSWVTLLVSPRYVLIKTYCVCISHIHKYIYIYSYKHWCIFDAMIYHTRLRHYKYRTWVQKGVVINAIVRFFSQQT